jgi:uncharacterized membrane protein
MKQMKPIAFFLIGVLLLSLALFHFFGLFQDIFKPVYGLIGSDVLYIGGIAALIIALFSWLPTWLSLLLFLALVFGGGFYFKDNLEPATEAVTKALNLPAAEGNPAAPEGNPAAPEGN